MTILAISDTHTKHDQFNIPHVGDILIHAGDYSYQGTYSETTRFLDWFAAQPQKYKVLVPGNHDRIFEDNPDKGREMCVERNIILLINEYVGIDGGLILYGCPMTPKFGDWAFMHTSWESKDYWENITKRMDVLISHGPPHKKLDRAPGGRFVGCPYHQEAIERLKPDVCIFGHIHLNGGRELHENGTSYYNVACLDERYVPVNGVRVIEL